MTTKTNAAGKVASRRTAQTARAVVLVPAAELVTVEHGQPVTTTECIATAAGIQHKNVLALVREHIADFQEFGRVAFETRTFATAGGEQSREVAVLNEPQSTLLFTFLRNTKIVRAVKVRLVREFFRVTAELNRLKAMQSAPAWQAARVETKRAFRLMTDVIKETRDDAGKPATTNTYMHESWTVNYAMTGLHQTSIDRDALPPEELRLLELIEVKNTVLFVRGLSRKDRQHILRGVVLHARADRTIKIGVL